MSRPAPTIGTEGVAASERALKNRYPNPDAGSGSWPVQREHSCHICAGTGLTTVSPVPAQMWHGGPSPGADVARWAQSRRRCGQGVGAKGELLVLFGRGRHDASRAAHNREAADADDDPDGDERYNPAPMDLHRRCCNACVHATRAGQSPSRIVEWQNGALCEPRGCPWRCMRGCRPKA